MTRDPRIDRERVLQALQSVGTVDRARASLLRDRSRLCPDRCAAALRTPCRSARRRTPSPFGSLLAVWESVVGCGPTGLSVFPSTNSR